MCVCIFYVVFYQVALEKAKDSFEDHATKTKADRNDKEMRVLQVRQWVVAFTCWWSCSLLPVPAMG